MKKKSKFAIGTVVFSMLFATSAFAATAQFTGSLPANQGDTEVSTVARANASDVLKIFYINIKKLDTGYSAVRAWTEGSWGGNYSNPYNEAYLGQYWLDYTTTPSEGANVTLNLDNPIYTSSTVAVEGEWSPN